MEDDKKKKTKKIVAIVIGSILSVLLIIIGYNAVRTVLLQASVTAPRDVIVSDITRNSAKVGWTTDQETQGVIEYGTSPTALNFFAPETAKTISHQLELTLLSPSTTYYFQVRIADQVYDNGGVPWSFTTRGQDAENPIPDSTNQQPGDATGNTPNNSDGNSGSAPNNSPGNQAPGREQPIVPTNDISRPTQPPAQDTEEVNSCTDEVCDNILPKIGKGCGSQDYIRCLKKGQ